MKGWCIETKRFSSLAPLEEREVGHPAERETVPPAGVLDRPGPADLAKGLEGVAFLSATRRARSASAPPRAVQIRFVVGLGRLEGRSPAILLLDPDQAFGPERLGLLSQLVELAAREGAGPGDEQALDLAARGEDGLEDLGRARPGRRP